MNKHSWTWLITVVATLALIAIPLAACQPTPEPTEMPPTEAPAGQPVEAPPEAENEWTRIQAAGKMVVGTSADYPPFEFINEDNAFDGFDIALMEEIGSRLGVEIEWQDIAFDGLIAALQAGKIDGIIAAMAATPERDEQVDFTINYYVGSDAILVQEGSGLAIAAPEEIAGSKIGTQTGTIHEQWVRENLVDTGDMDEANLVRYERADQAILDLKNGRLDVVVMDYYAAKSFVEQGGIELVLEENLMGESQAIAIPEGAEALKAAMDQMVQQLIDEGFVEQLVQEYLVEESEGEATEEEQVSGPAWEKIQAAGKMVVGTSADYPPFEFMNEDNEFDGFDIALMEEVGSRLGVEIEWQDIAFDGLIAALQAGKIDGIIAAMAATPERDEQVDFTINYYVGSDAILAQEGSGLAIAAPEEIAGKKIGTQTGTIHEQWVRENLVDTGDMDEANLVRYERADQAILDLKNGRLDVVVMDYYAAKSFVEQGGVELILEENLMGESQAIAIPEGAAGVKWHLDQVVQQLIDEGFVDELVQEYLLEEE